MDFEKEARALDEMLFVEAFPGRQIRLAAALQKAHDAGTEQYREQLEIEVMAHADAVKAHLFYMGRSKQFQERAEAAEALVKQYERMAQPRQSLAGEDAKP